MLGQPLFYEWFRRANGPKEILAISLVFGFARFMTIFCVTRRLGIRNATLSGPLHPRSMSNYEYFASMLTIAFGYAPAMTRIVSSFVMTLFFIPRLDKRLPWKEFRFCVEILAGALTDHETLC